MKKREVEKGFFLQYWGKSKKGLSMTPIFSVKKKGGKEERERREVEKKGSHLGERRGKGGEEVENGDGYRSWGGRRRKKGG